VYIDICTNTNVVGQDSTLRTDSTVSVYIDICTNTNVVGQDSTLRMFSTRHESSDKSLGRASYNKSKTKQSGLLLDEHMMPPIIDFHSGTYQRSYNKN